ncbi:AsnC family transcriptional regulator [Streptomyces olivaceoviridis]|uniref:AsnC family transcriptional regulator n=1 Tax=Streptomyces olivaceoviridis TaxID=1921 RepID=UPI001E44F89C|nr:AsnC family transcriptional regulator [Streptomyces olivaceoviridis]
MNATDSRIAAALPAAPRASWRTVSRVLGISERTVVRRAAPLFGDGTLRATAVRNPAQAPSQEPVAMPTWNAEVARAMGGVRARVRAPLVGPTVALGDQLGRRVLRTRRRSPSRSLRLPAR